MAIVAKPAILISNLEIMDVESLDVPMWIYDEKSLAFLAVNSAAVRRYGYSREEFLGMTILDIRPSNDVIPLLRETLGSGRHDASKDALATSDQKWQSDRCSDHQP